MDVSGLSKLASRALNRRWITVVLTAGALCATAAGAAHAGDDDDLSDDAMPVPESEPMVAVRNLDANVDGWLFGNRRFGDSPAAKLTLLLKVKAEEITRTAGLSESQNDKLLLAGEGDIRRFLDRVDEIKLKFRSPEVPQANWNRVFAEIQPFRQILLRNGLFGSDSLFLKTARTTLTSEQTARYEKGESDRRAFQHRTRIVSTVARLSDYLGLSDAQRKRLVEVTLEKTQPLPLLDQTDRDQLVGLAIMSRVPEKDIRPIFDNDQWRALKRLFERVPQTLPMLRQNGINVNGQKGAMLNRPERVIPAGQGRLAAP
jgi:hypothetical protein